MKNIPFTLLLILFILFTFLIPPEVISAVTYRIYPAVALTGGGIGALDKLDGDCAVTISAVCIPLNNGDNAIVTTLGGITYHYTLNATSGAAESSPDIIAPDTNAGTKRWILSSEAFLANNLDVNGYDIISTSGNINIVPVAGSKITLDGNVGIGNADPVGRFQVTDTDSLNNFASTLGNYQAVNIFDTTLTDQTLLVNQSSAVNYFDTSLEFTADVSGTKYINGFLSNLSVASGNSASLSNGRLRGIVGGVTHNGTGAVNSVAGGEFYGINESTATVAGIRGLTSAAINRGGGTINTSQNIYIPPLINTGSTITNTYGLWIGDQTDGTQTNNPYGIYQQGAADYNYFAGNVGFGTTDPQSKIQITNGYLQVDTITAAPTASDCDASAEAGRMNFDSTNDILYICSGSSGWVSK